MIRLNLTKKDKVVVAIEEESKRENSLVSRLQPLVCFRLAPLSQTYHILLSSSPLLLYFTILYYISIGYR